MLMVPLTGLDPDLLRAFVLIAEGSSFTQAASVVGRTQSAISMQIHRLEETLGQRVLSRGRGGGIELTSHGRYLLTRARQILALNDEVIATFRAPAVAGTVRLGCPDDYALAYIPPILKRFAETHPAVQVDVRCYPSEDLMRSIKADDLDLALISDGHQPPGWPVTELWRGPLVWVTSTRHSPHRQDPLPLALADHEPLRVVQSGGGGIGQGGTAVSDRLHLGLPAWDPCAGGRRAGDYRIDLVMVTAWIAAARSG